MSQDVARLHRARGLGSLALLASFVLAAGFVSLALGQDVNWDLKNYHFYGPYALLHGRLGRDIAPAQVQTYLNPTLDLPYYFLANAIPSARAVAFVMAASTGVAVFFLFRILVRVLRPAEEPDRWLRLAAAWAIGVTGAAGVSTIGSTMGEWPLVALMLAAIGIVLRPATRSRVPGLLLAGALVGAAAGLKPTYAIYGIAFLVALAAVATGRERLRYSAAYSGAALLGFVATTGLWCARLQREFGSPVFPVFNGILRSPFWEPISLRDARFLPRSLSQAIAYPFLFARKSNLVAEVSFVDYRVAALFVVAVLSAVKWIGTRRRRAGIEATAPAGVRPWRFLIVFSAVAYVAWLTSFGVYRYLVLLEVLSGLLIVSGVAYLAGKGVMSRLAVLAVAIAIVSPTRPMNWGRATFDGASFRVSVPELPPNALVVITGRYPVSYLIPFFHEETRFVSPDNNFLRLGQKNGLARHVSDVVACHEGPVYSLETRTLDDRDAALCRTLGLSRDPSSCRPVVSNLDPDTYVVCRLLRPSTGSGLALGVSRRFARRELHDPARHRSADRDDFALAPEKETGEKEFYSASGEPL